MRRSDRRIRVQDESLVAGNGTKTETAVATGLWRVLGNVFNVEWTQTAHRAVATAMAGRLGLGAARRPYLVKINFIPAIRRTEITRTAKRLLPRCEPTAPPMIAAAARIRPSEGIERTFVK